MRITSEGLGPRPLVQFCNLGDLNDVLVNGQRFAFEAARVVRVYASWEDKVPNCLRAEWGNVMWIDPETDLQRVTDHGDCGIGLTVPPCFIDSAPITDHRQPAAVTWADLIERALIDLAEKQGGWY
jgi:hypothetical protein